MNITQIRGINSVLPPTLLKPSQGHTALMGKKGYILWMKLSVLCSLEYFKGLSSFPSERGGFFIGDEVIMRMYCSTALVRRTVFYVRLGLWYSMFHKFWYSLKIVRYSLNWYSTSHQKSFRKLTSLIFIFRLRVEIWRIDYPAVSAM